MSTLIELSVVGTVCSCPWDCVIHVGKWICINATESAVDKVCLVTYLSAGCLGPGDTDDDHILHH
jgi:hypothetical protein